jgi:hypothetical protein
VNAIALLRLKIVHVLDGTLVMARSAPPHSLRSEATHSLVRQLRLFVVTLYVYTFNQKPEEKWKFPNNRSHANNHAK